MNHHDEGFIERRRLPMCLSEADIDLIAEKAAEKAIDKLHKIALIQIKLFWGVGAGVAALYYWLQSKGLVGKL